MNSIKEGFKVGGLKFICSVGAQTRLQLSLQLIHQGIQPVLGVLLFLPWNGTSRGFVELVIPAHH
ncbi:MAG: hypothetical protein WBL88_08255 [Nitrososphaeraceae archaeon]